MYIEVLTEAADAAGTGEADATDIVLLHGGNHGAWVYADHFLPWFHSHNMRAYALSLRGHGASDGRSRLRWHSMREYVEDVAQVVRERVGDRRFVLVGHSIGGGVVQSYLLRGDLPQPVGMVLLNTTTPAGWRKLVLMPGGILRHPLDVLRILVHFDLRYLTSTEERVREYFFSPDTPEAIVSSCKARLHGESFRALWDLLALRIPSTAIPIQVLGSESDGCMPPDLIKALADTYGVTAQLFKGGHDSMLDTDWERFAAEIAAFAAICGRSARGTALQN